MVAHTFTSSTRAAEAGGSESQEFKTSLVHRECISSLKTVKSERTFFFCLKLLVWPEVPSEVLRYSYWCWVHRNSGQSTLDKYSTELYPSPLGRQMLLVILQIVVTMSWLNRHWLICWKNQIESRALPSSFSGKVQQVFLPSKEYRYSQYSGHSSV